MATINLSLFDIDYLYPIVHSTEKNSITYRKDNYQWNNVAFTSTPWTHSKCSLGLKIRDVSYNTLLSLIENNRHTVNSLVTPGIFPFGDSATTNNVYILSVTESQRIIAQWRQLTLNLLRINP
jgi:hypothetical protein